MSMASGLVPSQVIIVEIPGAEVLLRNNSLGLDTSDSQSACISNTPSSQVAPNRFFTPLNNL